MLESINVVKCAVLDPVAISVIANLLTCRCTLHVLESTGLDRMQGIILSTSV
jgi:hypothetical protein